MDGRPPDLPGHALNRGGAPDADRGARALAFSHDDEIARPYYYGVTFQNGLKAEITPTDHAALMRFTFPGDDASLIFDNVDDQAALTIDQPAGTITGWSDANSGAGASRMFVYATFDKPMTASGMLPAGDRPGTGYARFDTSKGRVVTMRVATSLICSPRPRATWRSRSPGRHVRHREGPRPRDLG